MAREFDESRVRRHPRGSDRGGQFADQPDSGSETYDDWAARLAGRARPARKDGQYRRGQWDRTTEHRWPETHIEAVRHEMAAAGLDPAEIGKAIADIKQDLPAPMIVYENGPHKILSFISGPGTDEILQDIAALVDDLMEKYPVPKGGPVSISLVPPDGMIASLRDEEMPPGAMVAGETVSGTGSMFLNVMTVFSGPQGDTSMPAHDTLGNPLVYTMVHEWGHVIDLESQNPSTQRQSTFEQVGPLMSTYGQSSQAEAWAEAFAEFIITEGKTTHPGAQRYAKEYGWEPLNMQI